MFTIFPTYPNPFLSGSNYTLTAQVIIWGVWARNYNLKCQMLVEPVKISGKKTGTPGIVPGKETCIPFGEYIPLRGQLWSTQYLPQKEPLGFFTPIPTFTYPEGIAHLWNNFHRFSYKNLWAKNEKSMKKSSPAFWSFFWPCS